MEGKLFWIAAIVWMATGSVALGQAQTTGRISGKVTDEEGTAVGGARVTITSPALLGERVVETDDHGAFLAALLPAGAYVVRVSSPGKQAVLVSLRVAIGPTEPLAIFMKAGETLEEVVTVYAPMTPLETTVVGQDFDYPRQVEEVPIPERRVERVVELSPNVSNIPGRHRDYVSIAGAAPRPGFPVQLSALQGVPPTAKHRGRFSSLSVSPSDAADH